MKTACWVLIRELLTKSCWAGAWVCLCALGVAVGGEKPLSPEVLKFFEASVRPLLAEKCFKCHGTEKQKGNLRLDNPGSLLAGGESGPAVMPGKPDESLLIEAINYDSYEMPPDGKLSDEQIAILTKWVELGAPWPGSDSRSVEPREASPGITDADRQFWSFQPLLDPRVPEISGSSTVHNEIDHFVIKRLQANGLSPAEAAPPAMLVRRLYLDLTGLPPTPEQLDEFLGGPSSEAYVELVDQLLASSRYGEHQAQYWLDLVRYAESDGYKADYFRPDAWRYRDYVIRSFNSDKPYDRFVAEQIAGDEIDPDNPDALIATGFMRHGIYEYNQRDALTQWQDMLNDITDTTSDVFLGLGMGCARCHDHKFDPILQKDYFRLQAFFANIHLTDNLPVASAADQAAHREKLRPWEEATADIRRQIAEIEDPVLARERRDAVSKFSDDIQAILNRTEVEKSSHDRQITHLVELQVIEAHDKSKWAEKLKGEMKSRYESLVKQLQEFDHLKPLPVASGQTVRDYGVDAPPIFIPGKERLGEVQPGFLTIFEPEPASVEPIPDVPTSGRRSALASWLTRPDHPLTTRVIVNRIWQQHFGRGIVATPSDFGHLGEAPSHPELLDWLAVRFIESGWSIKQLHRRIVLSATYRQTSLRSDSAAQKLDPQNRLLWRVHVRRLEAEQVRDAMLHVAGELDLTTSGGPGLDVLSSKSRTIYSQVMRNTRDEILDAFDFPDRIRSNGERNITVSPNQSLLLINGAWTLQRAKALADRVRNDGALESQIRDAVRLTLGRDAQPEELQLLSQYAEQPANSAVNDPLIDICHVLLNSNEFLYID